MTRPVRVQGDSTTLLQVQVGDRVVHRESGRWGFVVGVALTPNGINDPSLVAMLRVKFDDRHIVATADKFAVDGGSLYESFYPSIFLVNGR